MSNRTSVADLLHSTVTAWIVLACSLLLTLLGWYIADAYARQRVLDRFNFKVEEARLAISKRMQEYEQVLRGGVGLFNASDKVTRDDWRQYVTTMRIDTYWPGIQGIGVSRMLTPAEVAPHERAIRAEGFPDYTVHPKGVRDSYSAIVYLEPGDWRNRRAFGYDMLSEPVRRAAMEIARDSGRPAVSGRVTLVQETERDVQAGFLMYLPVYRSDMPTDTLEQRRAALVGFVYSPFRIRDLLQGILGHGIPHLNFQVYDGVTIEKPTLLYVSQSEEQAGSPSPRYEATHRIELPGRTWTVQFQSLPAFEEEMESRQPQIIAFGGVMVDILLFSIILSLAGQRERIRTQVANMTEELRRSESRYRSVVEQVQEVIFQTDAHGRWTFLNPAWVELSGVSVEETLGGSILDFIHPEDRGQAQTLLGPLLECRSGFRLLELRCLHRDGDHRWVEVHARPTLDDAGKQILGISGSLIDISDRKRAEEEIRAFNQNLEQRVRERTAALQAKETQLRAALETSAEREREFRTLAENLPDNVHRTDCEGRLLYMNPTMERSLGLRAAELIGKALRDVFTDGRFDAICQAMRQVAADGESMEIEQLLPGSDGEPHHHAIHIVAERGADGRPVSALAVGRDLTGQKADEEKLRLAASVFHNSSEGVFFTNTETTILSVNPAFCEITGYSEEEVVGRTPRLWRSDRHDPEFYQALWDTLNTKGLWQGEIWNRRKDGEAYLVWLTINRIDDSAGIPIRYVAVFHDITESRQKDERIRYLAFHDAVTGLPNRTLLHDRLNQAIERARRRSSRFSVTFLDLDHFKGINDALGHDVGDLLLQEVAQRIRERLRRMDTAARMGGDEFVILMEDVREPSHCAALAEGILTAIAQPMQLRGHSVQMGTSLGIAIFPEDGDDPLSLMKHADTAMYAAKAAGRNTYRFFQPRMLQQTTDRLQLEMALRRAVTGGELEVYFQPKIALEGGQPLGVEALVRWNHPEHGLVPPAEFIPLAEECGLIGVLGHWVLDAVCCQGAAWRQKGLGAIPIAVNISARQMQEYDIAREISTLTALHGISPAQLEVELTESVVMADPEQVIKLFTRLRAMGIRVAIDDFGTGYSSLAYLRRLPIDVLKIDRSFIDEVDHNDEDARIVETILALSRTLAFSTVAEGVETVQQAERLRALGCNSAQGFLYTPPLPAEELEHWWQAMENSRGRDT